MFDHSKAYFSKKEKVSIYLEEFKIYRSEVIANQDAYLKTFAIGATAIAALLVVFFKNDTPSSWQALILALAFVIFVASVISVLIQYVHTERIGRYLGIIENRINELADTDMNWENKEKRAVRNSLINKFFMVEPD